MCDAAEPAVAPEPAHTSAHPSSSAGPVNLVVRQNGGTFDETVILCGINGF